MGEEVVAVLVVFVGIDAELRGLRPALRVDGLGLGILLRHKRRGRELAELQLALDAEKSRGAAYQRGACGHRYIACLDALYNIVLLALVCEL